MINSVDDIKAEVDNVEESIRVSHILFSSKISTQMVASYSPELYGTTEIEDYDINFLQELIGMLLWDTEIGGVFVLLETSIFPQYL